MTGLTDFLKLAIGEFDGAMDAFDRSESATSERSSAASLHVCERRERTAQTLALLSLAQDVRRVADTLKEIEGALVDASGAYR